MLRGIDDLGEAELLALVIGVANHRSSGAIAQELMDHFGDLAGVGRAAVEELTAFDGIGRAVSVRLKASFELGRRCVVSFRERAIRTVRSPEEAAALIVKVVTVAVGSLNAALVHPRELFKAAVVASAAGIILVHNHPTGSPEPSTEDTELTLRFVKCGELMGIELVDHIVIGGSNFVSMRERGLIAG
jgi:DNA repair protein RadC